MPLSADTPTVQYLNNCMLHVHDDIACFFVLGFESDDEYEEHDRHIIEQTRRNKGNKYGALPVEDPLAPTRHSNHGPPRYHSPRAVQAAHSDSNLNCDSRSHNSNNGGRHIGGEQQQQQQQHNKRSFSSTLPHSRYYPNNSVTSGLTNSSQLKQHNSTARPDDNEPSASMCSSDTIGFSNNTTSMPLETHFNSGSEEQEADIYNTSPYHDEPSGHCDRDSAYRDVDQAPHHRGDHEMEYHDNAAGRLDNHHGNQAEHPGLVSEARPPRDEVGSEEEDEEEYQEEVFNRKPNAYIRTRDGGRISFILWWWLGRDCLYPLSSGHAAAPRTCTICASQFKNHSALVSDLNVLSLHLITVSTPRGGGHEFINLKLGSLFMVAWSHCYISSFTMS